LIVYVIDNIFQKILKGY